jgi:hypothetical protein
MEIQLKQRMVGLLSSRIIMLLTEIVKQSVIHIPHQEYYILIVPRKKKQEMKIYFDEAIHIEHIKGV